VLIVLVDDDDAGLLRGALLSAGKFAPVEDAGSIRLELFIVTPSLNGVTIQPLRETRLDLVVRKQVVHVAAAHVQHVQDGQRQGKRRVKAVPSPSSVVISIDPRNS